MVFYLEVFEALKRIPTARDEVLRFLIRFRERVGASDQGADLQPVIEQLRQDPDLLASAMEIAECKDQEIRLIGLRLHPYGRAVQRDERIGQVEMAEDFVDELRVLGREQLSSLLNHTDPEKRQNLIAAAKTLIRLIDQLTELTPFCQEVRILHIVRDVEEIYATASSRREGREQVKHFLEHRLHLLYPDLTAHERATIERGAAALQQRDKEKEKGFQKRKILQDRESDLSAREVKLGVRFARVEVSLGGQSKRVPYKIMEDADHPGAFIVVRTDPKTGEVVPALRHGEKRYVEKNKEGFWKMAS